MTKKNKKEDKGRNFKQLLLVFPLFIVLNPFSVEAKNNKFESLEFSSKSTEESKKSRYFDKNIGSEKSLLYAQRNKTHVFYTNSYLNTGISVKRGDIFRIKASGNVRLGLLAGYGSPEGIPFSTNYNLFREEPHGRLMVRLKQSGDEYSEEWASAGKELEGISKKSGTLEFLVNDRNPENNVGNFRIEVTISSVPRIEAKSYRSALKCNGGQWVNNNNVCVMKSSKGLPYKRVARMGIPEGELSSLVLDLRELKSNDANIAFVFVINRHLNIAGSTGDSIFPVVKVNIKTDGKVIIDSKYGKFPPGYSPEKESARLIKLYTEEIQMLISALTKTQ